MRLLARMALSISLAALALAAGFPVGAQTPQAVLSVGSASGYPGQTGISVTVSLTSLGGAQVSAINFDLQFDDSRVSVVAATQGSAASAAGKSLTWNLSSAGRIRVMIFGFNTDVIGDGPVAVVTFNVLANATPGTFPLRLTNVAIADPGAGGIDPISSDGSFTVLAPPPTATPTATAAPPTPTATRTVTPTTGSTSTRTQTPTVSITRTPTRTATPGGPTATSGPSATPSRTPTAGSTLPWTSSPTVSFTLTQPPGPTLPPTASQTPLAPWETPPPPSLESPTSAGSFPPALETAVAATATALGLLDQAVIATATALALEGSPSPPAQGGAVPFGGILLLLGVIALGALVVAGAIGLVLWRRRAGSPEAQEAGDLFG